MILTKDNFNAHVTKLSIGDRVYIPSAFKSPQTFLYAGFIDDHYCFIEGKNAMSVFPANPNYSLLDNILTTTYEECCCETRRLCIESIDNFNQNQCEYNRIIILLNNHQMTDKEKVLKVYPDALVSIKYAKGKHISCGVCVHRFPRIFRMTVPIYKIYLGFGFTEEEAWSNAAKKLNDIK